MVDWCSTVLFLIYMSLHKWLDIFYRLSDYFDWLVLWTQGHFLSIMMEPCSSYSYLLIHICWNEPRELRMDPPTHGWNLLSLLLRTFTRMFCGDTSGRCFWMRSEKPFIIVVPPVRIMLENSSRLMSMSDFWIDSTIMFCTPAKPLISVWVSCYSALSSGFGIEDEF